MVLYPCFAHRKISSQTPSANFPSGGLTEAISTNIYPPFGHPALCTLKYDIIGHLKGTLHLMGLFVDRSLNLHI